MVVPDGRGPMTMSLDPKAQAALALHRFGLGPRAGSVAAIASDPRGALLAELDRAGGGIGARAVLTSGEAARATFEFRRAQREARQAQRAQQQQNPMPQSADAVQPPPQPPPRTGPGVPQQIYLDEAKARLDSALAAEIGFVERLVWFWSNHFCVSADKGNVRALCGPYEREAIRTHVLGRFSDMLLAVEQHPAMLIYLDNARSIGPDSIAGVRQKRGLNENLAREILELHTLGVRTGYTQEDVTRFANVITGWSVIGPRQDPARAGEFTFNERMHQPGAQTVVGKSYAEDGAAQGRAVLASLARRPETSRHISTKLARHFIADEPPPALVDRLARRFHDTDGDLKEMAKTLVTAPEAWDAPRSKLKRPTEWVVSVLRAGGIAPPDVRPVMQAQNLLGEPLWRPPAPKGFADESATWLDGLPQRLDIANQLARRDGNGADPRDTFEEVIGPLASTETRQAITRSESRPQALALLFMAPEFQRR